MSDPAQTTTRNEKRSRLERIMFARVEFWSVALLVIVLVILLPLWTYKVIAQQVFPHEIVAEIAEAIKGDYADPRPLFVRLASPYVFLPRAFPAAQGIAIIDETKYQPVHFAGDFEGPHPAISGMRIASFGRDMRFFLVWGSFVFEAEKSNIGALLIDNTGAVRRAWALSVPTSRRPGPQLGLDVSPEGTIAAVGSGYLTAWNWCGDLRWQRGPREGKTSRWPMEDSFEGRSWHHDVEYADGVFYSQIGLDIFGVDASTGEIISKLDGLDILRWAWRDNLSILEARVEPFRWPSLTDQNAADLLPVDPIHVNKIDVVSTEEAPLYPMLRAGDMVVSARNVNTVMILRPSEEKVLWWRQGLTSRQHDATLAPGGVEVFDNAPFSLPPRVRIRYLPFDTYEARTVAELSMWRIGMFIRGNFEHSGDRLLTVDTDSGRVIAGRVTGEIDMLFENGFDADGAARAPLTIRNATELTPGQIETFEAACN